MEKNSRTSSKPTRTQAKLEIFNFTEGYYNPRRLHSTLGYQTPDAFEQAYRDSHNHTGHAA